MLICFHKLSEAITAFMDDLTFLNIEDRVMGMTFSEFGRRIKSNSSDGTDHGAAAPLFVFGKDVQSGILGTNPVIVTVICRMIMFRCNMISVRCMHQFYRIGSVFLQLI